MKRFKRHKVKEEKPEASTSYSRTLQEYDLTYYIHDRVELMHQVFSVLRPKDLKSMAPECVRHISIDDLQELCTEELLGISSKRLCAILDGADPPSDTESSSESPERLETISLDSISSDEEILSETSKKSKKHKHHRRDSKTKSKKKKSKDDAEDPAEADKSRASRAGLTVLELLELQARARAIRAQLQQEHKHKQPTEPAPSSHHSSDNEVEIKEEPAEVVEISSEDEKPKIEDLREKTTPKAKDKSAQKSKEKTTPQATEPENPPDETDTHTVTKRVSNLIITVPQVKQTRKIKLNRSKTTVSVGNSENNANDVQTTDKDANKSKDVLKHTDKSKTVLTAKKSNEKDGTTKVKLVKAKEKPVKSKEKKKKQKKAKNTNQDSDHDEITLQLSDTEKMDLLEDLDRKNFDKLSSSESEDSESSSSDSSQESDEESSKSSPEKQNNKENSSKEGDVILNPNEDDSNKDKDQSIEVINNVQVSNDTASTVVKAIAEKSVEIEIKSPNNKSQKESTTTVDDATSKSSEQNLNNIEIENFDTQITEEKPEANDNIEITSIKDLPVVEDDQKIESVSVSSSPVREIEGSQDSPKTNTSKPDSPKADASKPDSPTTHTNKPASPKDDTNKQDSPKVDVRNKSKSPSNIIDKVQFPTKESRRGSADKSIETQPSTLRISVQVNSNLEQTNSGKRIVLIENIDNKTQETSEKDLSEGELSDKDSSEIEAVELQTEVVCISDDDDKKAHKKKKKKEKKSKSKKSKKTKQDFREGGDQNFYKETEVTQDLNAEKQEVTKELVDTTKEVVVVEKELISLEDDDYDDVYEILELSDDSSCYEVEGTVLSKEPTAEEIEALSARIDEIEREDIVTEEEIRDHEKRNAENSENLEELGNVSWKDRYLDSKKVKKVLTTSNIFNALRKKNRELKKKLEESKKKEEVAEQEKEEVVQQEKEEIVETNVTIEEGSIEHYNMLEGSTKYVDPVPEITAKPDETVIDSQNGEVGDVPKNGEGLQPIETPQVAKEIRKDAKQLLKMYKRLMKYNDMNKQKNPNKQKDPNKKKKKKAKKKNKDCVGAGHNII